MVVPKNRFGHALFAAVDLSDSDFEGKRQLR